MSAPDTGIGTFASSPPGMNRPLPFPKVDQELWDRTLKAGFETYPARHANYLKFQASKPAALVEHLPVRLDIENVSRCNFHCQMCQVSDWPGFKRSRDMTMEEYRALLDQQTGLIEVKLQGMGEPLLGKCYFDMIEYARARHIWVRSTTNSSVLHHNDNYKRIIDADICELQVSVDGTTAEVFEKIRRGSKFDQVCRNIQQLNAYARVQGRMRTRMWTVVQRDNAHQLEEFPKLAAELGFERCTLSLDLNDWGQAAWKKTNDANEISDKMNLERAERLIALGRERGVELTFWYMDKKYELGNMNNLCPWPFSRGYVSADMRLVPCCMIANPEVIDLGDAADLNAVWNGPKMQGFRKAHLTGKLPNVCKVCYYNGAH
ncbi:MAG: radical SAM protein [Opitutaceae bacterium]|nr:radical SAM protein [Opitutaceae bacterium]